MGGGVGYGSMGLCPQNPGSGRMRACTESVLARKVMSPLRVLLEEAGLMTSFVEVEMPTVALLSRMELNGMGAHARTRVVPLTTLSQVSAQKSHTDSAV